MDDQWLVWSNEHDAWWGPRWHGYFTNILAAGVYTKAEADEIVRNTDRRETAHRLADVVRATSWPAGTVGHALGADVFSSEKQ